MADSDVEFRCDWAGPRTPLPHVWEHTIGSGHALLALRADWQDQMRRARRELGVRHVRFHGLLNDDLGTVIDQGGKLQYSFVNADRIWDFLLSIGMRPFVELGFMPIALASGPDTVFRYKGNVTPPKDYAVWEELVRRLAAHAVDRYGPDEIREWFWEVWNEPNLRTFWTGTQADYLELYRRAAAALKGVDGRLRVGGPATAKNEWVAEFVGFCERTHTPADFVTTHHYPTDAFGKEGDDTEAQLAASRRGVLRDQAADARRQAGGRPVYYTEWASSSNPRDPLHDGPYAAAFAVKTVLEAAGLVEGYSYWTFSDLFEENYFPSIPFHGGFGLLTVHGVAKPAYRAFQLLHRLGTEVLPVRGTHRTVDAWVTPHGQTAATVLLTNHALPRHPVQAERVRVRLAGAPDPRSATIDRIDDDHANPRALWRAWAEPEYLSRRDVERLHAASDLRAEVQPWCHDRTAPGLVLDVTLPPHGVAAVTLEFGGRGLGRGVER